MNAEEFLALVRRRSFIPLRIFMSDGTTYELRHPDNVLVLRTRVDIGVPINSPGGVVDRVDYLSLLHVVRVEEAPAAPTVSAN
jgi:hypothetical protein